MKNLFGHLVAQMTNLKKTTRCNISRNKTKLSLKKNITIQNHKKKPHFLPNKHH